MATRIRKTDPVHAVVSATHVNGYGHVTVHIYELMPYRRGTVRISCQSGGENESTKTYAWQHGVSNDGFVLDIQALKQGYSLMKRASTRLDKLEADMGSPKSFADYALRTLIAFGVRKVHLLPGVNSRFRGDAQVLPALDPQKPDDKLLFELTNMEKAILQLS